jgi:2-oxoglutarate ferredoxin oxidoreductase subunit alpha
MGVLRKEFIQKGLLNMEKINFFKVKIAGQAGQGIKSAGLTFSKFATRSGFNIYNYIEYPSLIRGGHNAMQLNISAQNVSGPSKYTDFLIALNQDSIHKHKDEMLPGSFVLFDANANIKTDVLSKEVNLLAVPLNKIAHDAGGKELLINTVALGVLAGMMDGDLNLLKELIRQEYGSKEDLLNSNLSAIEQGYQFAKDNFQEIGVSILKLHSNKPTEKKMVINGDESVALGAISAGLQFAAIYPMSPISNILHTLALYQKDYSYIYKQPEDEISAINMAIGASFAGARSMTATSGGGFCLMTEAYGLAGITETPLVIIEGMRGGPATGLPTWSSQGDLQFVLHAHQDEFPRIVLAAGDVSEAFYLTMEAFYLADKYQTPVVVLIDKNICDDEESVPVFNVDAYRIDRGKIKKELDPTFKRYLLSSDGISERTIPGLGNFFIANSDEHDEFGYSNEEIENRNNQMEKRMQKLITCSNIDMPAPEVYGPSDAKLSVISWGSNKGSINQAIKSFDEVNYLHLTWLNPFPTEFVKDFLNKASNVVLMECNYTAQLGQLINEKTGIDIKDKVLKYDGRPFFVEEVQDVITSRLNGKEAVK